jgi:hypothetical protein
MGEDELEAIGKRYGSRGVPPWVVTERADGRGYLVRSSGGNDIIAIKHYSPTIAAAVADIIAHCHEDVSTLLRENERLRAALLREVADRRYQEDHGGAGSSLYDTFGRGDPWPGVKGIAAYEAEASEELARRGER